MTAEGPEPPADEILAAAPIRRRAAASPASLPPGARLGTLAVHAGRRPDLNAGSVVPPIYQTSTFHYPAEFSEAAVPENVRIYSRYTNPSQEAAAETLRALEGAEAARVFASGMAAVSTTLLSLVRPGDIVAASEEIYGGTFELLRDLLPRFGVAVRWVPSEPADPSEHVPEGTRLLYLETPTNPLLRVRDLAHWSRAADRAGALLVVDNTFATPINQRPLTLGADLVVHSASKYLGGHSDLIAGAVAGPSNLLERLGASQRILGGSLDPLAAFLLQRGMKTLALRVARQNENAGRLVEGLERHSAVAAVHYPGRAGSADEAVAARQMSGRGGMVSFELAGGRPATNRFLRSLRLAHVASSLGSVESLVSAPAETSHAHLASDVAARLGIGPGLVRFSCGIEEPDDLWEDVRTALDA